MASFSSTSVDLKSPSEAEDFEEYQKLDAAVKTAPPVQEPPAKTEQPPAEPADKAESQTAEDPGASQPIQDKGKRPERKYTAEQTISRLTGEKRDAERKAEALERKLAELQKNGAIQVTPPAPVKPIEEAKPAMPGADAEPDLEEYFKKYPEDTISKVYARFNRDHFSWLDKQAQATRAKDQATETSRQQWRQKLTERPDVPYEAIAGRADDPGSGISLYNFPTLQQQFPNLLDVLYHLHDNPAEYQRVRAMTPQDQYFEVGLMARQLKADAAASAQAPVPEKHTNVRPMVSRLPAPQKTVLNGSMISVKKNPAEASSYEEYEPLERQRTGR
jgi:hypothetical protein